MVDSKNFEIVKNILEKNKTITVKYTYTDQLDNVTCEIRKIKEFEGELILETNDPGIADIEIDVDTFNQEEKYFKSVGLEYHFSE